MPDLLLSPAARRHIGRLTRAIAPAASRLDRKFKALLRQRPYDGLQIRAFLAITPAAASRSGSLRNFLEQVEYNGRRLAKLNLPPAEVFEVLREFDPLLGPFIDEQYQPAREQLQLATIFTLTQAFYQVREAETQAFFGLYQAEAEANGLEDLLERFLRVLTQAVRAHAGRLLVLDSSPDPRLSRPLYIEKGQAAECLILDPELRQAAVSYWSLPLRAPALVQFGFTTQYRWLPRELALLDALGERCSKAIDRARMEDDLARLKAEGVRAEEEERGRIGRELHDETAQSLVWLHLQLQMLERDASELLRPRLREVREVAETTVAELRRILAALSPSVLDRLGLRSALKQLAARFRKTHPARVGVRISLPPEAISPQVQQVIYRVAQESLQNISKHSQASLVNLSLEVADRNIRLSVTDNGAGFSAGTAARQRMSFGLAGMRERAALLGGSLQVESMPGTGCKVRLRLPYQAAVEQGNDKDSSTSNGRSHFIPAGNPDASLGGARH